MNSSQIFDLAVVATLLYCAWKGASRGLISQAAWVCALVLCFKFSDKLAPAVEPAIAVDQPLRRWIAMAVVYLGLCLVSFVAAGMLTSWLEKSSLKDVDRHLGALLGFVKGVIVCMTAMFFGLTLSESSREVIKHSRSGYAAALMLFHVDPLIPLVPEGAKPTVKDVVETFNRNLKPTDDLKGGTSDHNDVFGGHYSNNASGQGTEPGQGNDGGRGGFGWSDLIGAAGSLTSGSKASDPGETKTDPGPQSRTEDVPLSELLRRIPGQVRDELTSKAMDSLRNSTPDQRRELLDQLRQSVPQDAGAILDDFVRGSTTGGGSSLDPRGGSGASSHTQLSRSNTQLLDQIAGIYGDRQQIVSRTRQYFAGVPDQVQQRVLEDWNADVMQLKNDPDPTTTVETRLDERIVRQLDRAGISFDRLERTLRTRLSQSMR